jgi:glycosyltransferase involved in cell wall biosynthesis
VKFLIIASFGQSILSFRGALIESLQSLGLDLHVLFPHQNQLEVSRSLLDKGVKVHDFKLSRKGTSYIADFLALIDLFLKIRAIKPEIVLSYTIKPVVYTGLISLVWPIQSRYALITGLGYAFQNENCRRNLTQILAQTLYRFALRGATKVFFQNPDDERLFRERSLLNDETPSVVVNGSGVDVAFFKPCDLPPRHSFLLIARLIKAKGILEFAEAAESIVESHENVSFKIAGWTETGVDSIPQEVIDSWSKNRTVEFLGPLEDVRSAISDSSVYVLPSYREGTPRTVLEAMAMGRAIITTDVPGCRETVIDGHNGYLVPPRDSKALSHAMHRFLDDPSLALIMGKRSRRIAVEKYDVDKVNEVILREMDLLESV